MERYHITLNGERATVLVYSDSALAPDVLEIVLAREAEHLARQEFGDGGEFVTLAPRTFAYTRST